jgi:rRNA-processing protein FCF1
MKILLDTNFLLYCAKQKIDYSEAGGELFVMSTVIDELTKLQKAARKQEDKESAGLAIKILEKFIESGRVKKIKTSGKADNLIVHSAGDFDAVATMDRELKDKLKGKTRIFTIRSKNKLEMV